MKCPLFTMKSPVISTSPTLLQVECLKEGCPWWCEDLECCDPTGLIPTLQTIGTVLGKLYDVLNSRLK